jgi:hypothetical protein
MSITFYIEGEIDNDDFEVNVANSNAAEMFRTMGVEFDYCGASDKFAAKAVNAIVMIAYAGNTPDYVGYFSERLARLAQVAIEADKQGKRVVWA